MASTLEALVRKRSTLTRAWLAIQRNGRLSKSPETRAEIKAFAENSTVHLERIQSQLRKTTFVFKPAKGVKAKKPGKAGFRPLVIAPVESRIVQRAVHDVLLTVPGIEALIRTPYSFGGVKKHENDEFSAVPAAIKAVLEGIGSGGAYIMRSDISKFFTRIPKAEVRKIVAAVIEEPGFLNLYDQAVTAELINMKELREDAKAFPIEDLGVAQGNSLSPLLGNLLLKDFDEQLNAIPGIRCIRYIDDFILLGPNRYVIGKAFEKAKQLLNKWQMTLAKNKTEGGSSQQRFEFLGIEFDDGFLRPSSASRARLHSSTRNLLLESQKSLLKYKSTKVIEKREAVLRTLVTLSDTMNGWAMHYRICNDSLCLQKLDGQIAKLVDEYLAVYRSVRNNVGVDSTWSLMGIQSLDAVEKSSFLWPRSKTKAHTS